jgi:hypothetical protein
MGWRARGVGSRRRPLGGLTLPARRLQEALGPGHVQELVQLLFTERLAEAGGEGGADGLPVSLAVQLSEQEMLLLAQVVVGTRTRVLDDVLSLIAERTQDQLGAAAGQQLSDLGHECDLVEVGVCG